MGPGGEAAVGRLLEAGKRVAVVEREPRVGASVVDVAERIRFDDLPPEVRRRFVDCVEGEARPAPMLAAPTEHRSGAALLVAALPALAFALTLGLGLVVFTIRRLLRRKPAPAAAEAQAEIDPAMLEKIEKDLAKLD